LAPFCGPETASITGRREFVCESHGEILSSPVEIRKFVVWHHCFEP
jgi:hypothetical protein